MANLPGGFDPGSPPARPAARPDGGSDDSPFSVRSASTYVPSSRAPRGMPGVRLAQLAFVLGFGVCIGWLAGRSPKAPKAHPARAVAPVAVAPPSGPAPAPPLVEDPQPPVADLGSPRSNWTTIGNAEAVSRRTGKPVLLDFHADWSPECRAMKREVFDDASLGEVVRRAVVPVSVVDRSRENGGNPPEIEALLQNYSVEGFPTLVVYLPGSGRVIQRRGYGGAVRTARWIQDTAGAVR